MIQVKVFCYRVFMGTIIEFHIPEMAVVGIYLIYLNNNGRLK